MYLITNRALSNASTLRAFGKKPSPQGPNELRLVKVEKTSRSWRVKAITDKLSTAKVTALNAKYNLNLNTRAEWHASLEVACELFDKARSEKRSILFFVHGYNNDIRDVLKAAEDIEELYGVIVVPFTWPANGGGAVSGTASYLSDKADARVSAGAFNRAVGKIQDFHLMLTEALKAKMQLKAYEKHPDNPEAASQLYVKLMEKECPIKLNLLCHSMGNYVFKNTLSTSDNNTSKLVFDNICLVAADTNNANHADWVGRLDVRNRIYIVINENDSALKASRIKPGKEQKARLGHYTKELNSANAHYIDATRAEEVDSKHSYFKGEAVERNLILKSLFEEMFKGNTIEHFLDYHVDNNSYTLKSSC